MKGDTSVNRRSQTEFNAAHPGDLFAVNEQLAA